MKSFCNGLMNTERTGDMSTKTDVLDLLSRQMNVCISGQRLADELSVSRNAVWKAITSLKEEGYPVESRGRSGYCLTALPDVLSMDAVLDGVRANIEVSVRDTVTSTNDVVKEAEFSARPVVVIANRQTGGRGRMGRSFASPAGTGVYMSFGIRPDFSIAQSPFVTMAVAVAVCEAIEKVCGIDPRIKWVNDLYANRKKICGILTEAQTNVETGVIDRLIVGIGVNCFPGSFPEEIRDKAGSIADHVGAFSRSDLVAEIINRVMDIMGHVESGDFLDDYRRRCFILGEEIYVHPLSQTQETRARALSVEDDGGLLVEYLEGEDKGIRTVLHTGEISIRLHNQLVAGRGTV